MELFMISLSRSTLFILILSLLCHAAWSNSASTVITLKNHSKHTLDCGSGNTKTWAATVSTQDGKRSALSDRSSVKVKIEGTQKHSQAVIQCKNSSGDLFVILTINIPYVCTRNCMAKQSFGNLGQTKAKSQSNSTFSYTTEGQHNHSAKPASGSNIPNSDGATIIIE